MSSEATSTRGSRRARRGGAQQSVFSRNLEEAARALYHCNYCRRDISDNIRIKCAVCADFDLCVECFGVGVELAGHAAGHAYRVMDNLSFPIFHPSWGSDEELLLLEAVEIYGLGNWAAVAEHVGTKSSQECGAHYLQTYIEPPSCPLPTPAPEMAGLDVAKLAEVAKRSCGRKRMRLDPSAAAQQLKQLLQQDGGEPGAQPQQQQQQQDGVQVKQEQQNNAGSGTPGTVKMEPGAEGGDGGQQQQCAGAAAASPMDIDGAGVKQEEEQQQEGGGSARAPAGTPGSAQHAGHAKGSFRQRAAEEAAAAAADGAQPQHASTGALGKLHAAPSPRQQRQQRQSEGGDGEAQQQQQQQQGQAGEAAAAAAAASGLMAPRSPAAAAAAAGGSAAAAAAGAGAAGSDAPRVKGSGPQLDMLTGWHPKRLEFEPEWDHDAEAAIAEIEFREGEPPEQEAAKLRLLEIYNRRLDERARRQAFILEHGLLNVRRMQGTDKRRLPGEKEKHAQMRVFARYQPPGSHDGFVEGLLLEGRLRLRIAELQAHRAAGRRTLAEVEEAEQVEAAAKKKAKERAVREAMLAGMSLAQAGQQEAAEASGAAGGGAGPGSLGGYRSTASALSVYRQRQGFGLDISALPGHGALTSREAELCASARLLPSHYLSLKDVMMRDAQVHGHISRNDARGFFRLEPARSARVWEVLCASGWLKGTAPEEAEDKRRWPRKRQEVAAVAAAAAAAAAAQQQQQLAAAATASLAVGFPPAPGGKGGGGGEQQRSEQEAAAAAAAAVAAVMAAAASRGAGGAAAAAAVGAAAESGMSEGGLTTGTGITGSGAVAAGGGVSDVEEA